mmetsp:Transcript_9891/g.28749  ORF Transcript_9891/g.28749 Transcript_9891/m.28749 type:complete len:114 (+) Transcript_9891:2511-2852(+)
MATERARALSSRVRKLKSCPFESRTNQRLVPPPVKGIFDRRGMRARAASHGKGVLAQARLKCAPNHWLVAMGHEPLSRGQDGRDAFMKPSIAQRNGCRISHLRLEMRLPHNTF